MTPPPKKSSLLLKLFLFFFNNWLLGGNPRPFAHSFFKCIEKLQKLNYILKIYLFTWIECGESCNVKIVKQVNALCFSLDLNGELFIKFFIITLTIYRLNNNININNLIEYVIEPICI